MMFTTQTNAGPMIHVKNEGEKPVQFMWNGRVYEVAPQATEIMEEFLYFHALKQPGANLRRLDPSEGDVEYARSFAAQKEREANAALATARIATEAAEKAKKELAAARANAKAITTKE